LTLAVNLAAREQGEGRRSQALLPQRRPRRPRARRPRHPPDWIYVLLETSCRSAAARAGRRGSPMPSWSRWRSPRCSSASATTV